MKPVSCDRDMRTQALVLPSPAGPAPHPLVDAASIRVNTAFPEVLRFLRLKVKVQSCSLTFCWF